MPGPSVPCIAASHSPSLINQQTRLFCPCSDLEEASRLSPEAADVDWDTTFPIGGVGKAPTAHSLSSCTCCDAPQGHVCAAPPAQLPHHQPNRRPLCSPSAVPGEVHAAKDYGLLCDLAAHEDVVGMAAPNQVRAGNPVGVAPSCAAFQRRHVGILPSLLPATSTPASPSTPATPPLALVRCRRVRPRSQAPPCKRWCWT